MTPRARRIVVPIVVGLVAVTIVSFLFMQTARRTRAEAERERARAAEIAEAAAASGDDGAEAPRDPDSAARPEAATDAPAPMDDQAAADGAPESPAAPLGALRARAPDRGISGTDEACAPLGSLDPATAPFEVRFSRIGAGIERIAFSDIWETAGAKHRAEVHRRAVAAGGDAPTPDESQRYVLVHERRLVNDRLPDGIDVPELAANEIRVDGQRVNLMGWTRDESGERVWVWAETAPGTFETEVVDETGTPILAIERRWSLGPPYGLVLNQTLRNLADRPLEVLFSQFGPGDLRVDRSRYMDRRRFRFGYVNPAQDPDRLYPRSEDSALLLERQSVVKREAAALWPNDHVRQEGLDLSWFGVTNRYFAFALAPAPARAERGPRTLDDAVAQVIHEKGAPEPGQDLDKVAIFTHVVAPAATIPVGGATSLDMLVYAGPLDRHVLDKEAPWSALGMGRLVLYQMSKMCAFCTFQWLAILLLNFLHFLHDTVLFDWGLAIIALVVVVRAILHPITKRSQINMQRFGKQMQAMKPEIDKLQKKYGSEPKRMQAEQMRLMREHGINPAHMLGCLPMFLQTPIWIALYAMLYFAFDLRQQPAFFGVFQKLTGGAWTFLADLSSADHFLGEFAEPKQFLLWNLTGLNLLPILMGAIFFVQQKYMSPPPSPTMTAEQLQQQKIMKWMMVLMMPLMLYSAPSGLTLYIITSSTIGILESRYIRNHLKDEDLKPKPKSPGGKAKGRSLRERAMAAAMERAEERRREKMRGPERKFKRRD